MLWIRVTTCALLAFLAGGCGSTRMEDSRAAPGAGPIRFERAMVLVATPDLPGRKRAEDALVRSITTVELIPSYQVIPREEDIRDADVVRFFLTANACDGIIVLTPAYRERDVTTFQNTETPAPYLDFYSYYHADRALRTYYTTRPGTYVEDVYGIETAIYETAGNRLIWSGQTRTRAPSDIDSLMGDVVDSVGRTLKRQGLVARD